MHRVALDLHGKQITVITSDPTVFDELCDDAGIELVLLGGMVPQRQRSSRRRRGHGHDARRSTAQAGHDQGCESDRARRGWREVPSVGVPRVCGPDDLDVVTTASATPAMRLALQEAGVDVIEA